MARKRPSRALRVLGVMTGTSCDGLDAGCLEFRGHSIQVRWMGRASYPAPLRKRVLALQNSNQVIAIADLLALDRDLGRWYGSALSALIRKNSTARPDVIANHGQTISHHPFRRGGGVTYQMGNPYE